MLVYGTLSGEPLQFSGRTLMTNAAKVEGFWLSNHMSQLRLPAKLSFVRSIGRLVTDGVLRSEIAGSFPLDGVQDAVSSATQSPSTGKTIIRIGDG